MFFLSEHNKSYNWTVFSFFASVARKLNFQFHLDNILHLEGYSGMRCHLLFCLLHPSALSFLSLWFSFPFILVLTHCMTGFSVTFVLFVLHGFFNASGWHPGLRRQAMRYKWLSFLGKWREGARDGLASLLWPGRCPQTEAISSESHHLCPWIWPWHVTRPRREEAGQLVWAHSCFWALTGDGPACPHSWW